MQIFIQKTKYFSCILNYLIEICKTPKKFLMRLLKIEIGKKFLVLDFVFEYQF